MKLTSNTDAHLFPDQPTLIEGEHTDEIFTVFSSKNDNNNNNYIE